MSNTIKAAIQALKGRIADAYTAIVAKGGTLPATQDSANLPAAIASIPSGGVQGYEFSGGITASTLGELFSNQAYLTKINDNMLVDFLPVEPFGRANGLTEINLPNLEIIRASKVFYDLPNITSINMPKLKTITGAEVFRYAGFITLELPELTTWSGNYACTNCGNLERLYLPKLSSMFYVNLENCPKLIDFETGGYFTGNMDFRYWNPTLTDPTVLATFLSNIRNHMAANLRTDVGNHTIRFHANVKAAIQASQATMDAFPANWTIA